MVKTKDEEAPQEKAKVGNRKRKNRRETEKQRIIDGCGLWRYQALKVEK